MAGLTEVGLELGYTTVDVFTTTPFEGNPLAIVDLKAGDELTQEQKQRIAKEFNYSETVILHPAQEGEDGIAWPINIFTIDAELPFAGHPVIGTANSIFSKLPSAGKTVLNGAFLTKAGRIGLEYDVQKKVVCADIPHNTHLHSTTYPREELVKLQPTLQGLIEASRIFSVVKGMSFVLVQVPSVQDLEATSSTPHSVVCQLDEGWNVGFKGMYLFTKIPSHEAGDGSAIRLRTRLFVASVGEDPATGSAACALASYLALHEGPAEGTLNFEVTQGVEMGRRSEIGVEVVVGEVQSGGRGIKGLRLRGQAVTMMEGKITVPKRG